MIYEGIRLVWDVEPHYARHMQVLGLMGAARCMGVAFGLDEEIPGGKDERVRIIITTPDRLGNVDALAQGHQHRIALLAPFYDQTPESQGRPVYSKPPVPQELDAFEGRIAVALSELSYDGNRAYMAGYAKNHGIPVMTFPWAADARLLAISSVDQPAPQRDCVLIASYTEKRARLDQWVVPAISGLESLIIGPGWRDSTLPDVRADFRYGGHTTGVFDWTLCAEDYLFTGTWLYRTSAVALNVHHDYEADWAYTCNERTFTAAACGAFVVCDDNIRVGAFFAEDEVLIARSPDEMSDMVHEGVESPGLRAAFRACARERIREDHTYEHRLGALLDFVVGGRSEDRYCGVLL